ncbi:unnamed protein product [Angiostrongylus costaricensis]|uniref:P53 domain-containing protein n=1 Tax=Angiostrongylus costaricensis TaxID=334426 RepID=A0A0R3PAS2_ANGCS|nr:unnamed protein product [Angiostrongylus costaricensis]
MREYSVGTSPDTSRRGLTCVNVKCARVAAYKQQINEVVFIFWWFDLATGRMATRSTRSTSFGFAACDENIGNQRTQLGNTISNALYGEFAQPAVQQQHMGQWMVNTGTRMGQQTFDQGDHKSHAIRMVRNTQTSSPAAVKLSQDRIYQQFAPNDSEENKRFTVGVTPQLKSSRNFDYVFGTATAKNARTLYCKAEVMVPFMFTFPPNCDSESHIRVRAEYVEERYMSKPVARCPNHLAKDGSDIKMHFVRCEHSQTEYLDSNENYELRIPVCQKTGFMFMCFNSCSGGINRRLVQITFVLEGA